MPKYSEEFKREAVRLVREERMSVLQAARVTGANHNTIRECIRKADVTVQVIRCTSPKPMMNTG